MSRIIKAVAASTIALGLATALPVQAEANPLIIAPAVAVLLFGGAAVGGAVLGASAAHANDVAAPTPGTVVVTDNPPPAPANCYMTRGLVHGVWRRVQVCN